jgi:hypothetical protein
MCGQWLSEKQFSIGLSSEVKYTKKSDKVIFNDFFSGIQRERDNWYDCITQVNPQWFSYYIF